MTKKELIKIAIKARENSYSPYSKFKVGSAVLTKDGKVFTGSNIENASFGLTICAERNAIFACYAHGYKKKDIKAIAVVADTDEVTYPCGACRQVLGELMPNDAPIYLYNLKFKGFDTTIKEILPGIFTKKFLK